MINNRDWVSVYIVPRIIFTGLDSKSWREREKKRWYKKKAERRNERFFFLLSSL